jgi:hypothetical protein
MFTGRVQLANSNICAALRATLPDRAIVADIEGVAEPATKPGKLHCSWVRDLHYDWVRNRGLPWAMKPHDHRGRVAAVVDL